MVRELLWSSPRLRSSEHVRLREEADGHRLEGTVTLALGDDPAAVHYTVEVASDWVTRSVEVRRTWRGREDHHRVVVEGGTWVVDGRSRDELAGCVDVDLGWTPATNTLPIRRLGAQGIRTATLQVAWMRWPELAFERSEQAYEQLSDTTWRYSSGTFAADLEVDASGLVLRYGDGIWTASARWAAPDPA